MPDPIQTSARSSSPTLGYRAPESSWHDMFRTQKIWLRSKFTREQVISNLKTLAWVVPLTLLIWVYAEREQVATYKDETIPFELKSQDPNRVVSLTHRQDKNLIVDLQGPQGRVQEVLQKLRGGRTNSPNAAIGLQIELPPTYSPNRVHELSMVATLQRQPIFADYGITVTGCQPSQLEITVDELIEREVPIVARPSVKNLEPTSAFDPPTAKVRGPRTLLDAAASTPGGKLELYADIPEDILKQPGHHPLQDVPLTRPANLADDRVSIVTPAKVKAVLDVRPADVPGVIPSMPVQFLLTPQLWDKYKMDMTVWKGLIQNVHVTGPKDIIDQINKENFAPKPLAFIQLTADDVKGDLRSKAVSYTNLPDGVKVAEEDLKRTVEFRLTEKLVGEQLRIAELRHRRPAAFTVAGVCVR